MGVCRKDEFARLAADVEKASMQSDVSSVLRFPALQITPHPASNFAPGSYCTTNRIDKLPSEVMASRHSEQLLSMAPPVFHYSPCACSKTEIPST